MTTKPLPVALEDTLGSIDRAIDRIREGKGDKAELQTLRAYLLNILELIERNSGIEAAADDLYDVATAYVVAGQHDSGRRNQRALQDAMLRFRDRLGMGEANEQARWSGVT